MVVDFMFKRRIKLLVNNILLVFTERHVLSAVSADNLEIERVQKIEPPFTSWNDHLKIKAHKKGNKVENLT